MPVCDYLARLFKQRRLFQIKITLTLGGGRLFIRWRWFLHLRQL